MFEDNCYYYDHGDQDFLCNFPTLEELEESVKRFIGDFHAVGEDTYYSLSDLDFRISLDARNKPFPEIVCWPVRGSEYGYFCRAHSFDPEDCKLWVDVSDIMQFSNLDDAHALAVELHEFLRQKIEDEIEGAAQIYEMVEADIAKDEAEAQMPDEAIYTNIVIEFTRDMRSERSDIILFCHYIAEYGGFRKDAEVNDPNVGFLRGRPLSGGSRHHWYVEVPAGCIVELAYIRRDFLARALPTVQAKYPDLRITVKDKPERLDPVVLKRAALESQKSSLLAQVAQIDAELSTLSN